MVGDSNDETNFRYKLIWTNTQILRLRKVFVNNTSGNIYLSKNQLHKIRKSREFLGRLLGTLLKSGLPLIKIHLNN